MDKDTKLSKFHSIINLSHTHTQKKFYLAPHVPKTVDIDILPSSLK